MRACNYDFVRDNSHSSDLNVVSFCEGKRQHFDEVLPLHLERDRTIHLHQRNTPSPPSSPHSCLHDLGGWHALSSKRQEQRTRRITEGYGSSLKHFRGLGISSDSYKSENKVSVASDAELIRWSQDVGWGLCTFTKRSIKDKDLNIINHYFASTKGIHAMI